MYDKELAREILQQIHHAAEIVMQRFEPIKNVNDFTDSPSGMEKSNRTKRYNYPSLR